MQLECYKAILCVSESNAHFSLPISRHERIKNMNESADMQDFLNHLTDNALLSLKYADQVARTQGSAYVGTEHVRLPLK